MEPNLTPSLVRTGSPFIAGLVGSWLARQGMGINDDALSAVLVAVFGYGYYFVARFGETFLSDKWGYVLGMKTAPVYRPPDLDAPRQPMQTDNRPRDEDGQQLWVEDSRGTHPFTGEML